MPRRTEIRHSAAAALQEAAVLGQASQNPVAVTGAAASPAGLVRLTVASSANLGGKVVVAGVGGTVEANGRREIIPVDGTHIDLYGTVFENDYAGGGTVTADYAHYQPLVGAILALSATWPSQLGKATAAAPQLLLYAFQEKNKSLALAGTAPEFETTLTLVLEVRIEIAVTESNTALTSVTPPADPMGDTIDNLCRAARRALLTNMAFVSLFSHIGDGECALKPDGTGLRQIENAYLSLDVVFNETFEPVITERLSGFNLYLDALNIVDPSGTYAPPFAYTPTPAPRDAGPDGRVEIGATFDLPQT